MTYDHFNNIHLELEEFYFNDSVDKTIKKSLHILSLNAKARPDEIKKAYRKAVSEYHPDKTAHLGRELQIVAEKKIQEINEAYDILIKAGLA